MVDGFICLHTLVIATFMRDGQLTLNGLAGQMLGLAGRMLGPIVRMLGLVTRILESFGLEDRD
jgi:hypothetical protein